MTGAEFRERREAMNLSVEDLAKLFTFESAWITKLEELDKIPTPGLYDHAFDSLESEYAAKRRQPDLDLKMMEVEAVRASVGKLLTKSTV